MANSVINSNFVIAPISIAADRVRTNEVTKMTHAPAKGSVRLLGSLDAFVPHDSKVLRNAYEDKSTNELYVRQEIIRTGMKPSYQWFDAGPAIIDIERVPGGVAQPRTDGQ